MLAYGGGVAATEGKMPGYFAFLDNKKTDVISAEPVDAIASAVWLDGDAVSDCIFSQACWFKKPFRTEAMRKHASDELLVFIGSDVNAPEAMNAEISLWIENDELVFTQTCIVFIPAGAAHGRMEVRNVKRPVIHYSCLMGASYYEAEPAEASAPAGTYADNRVEKYAPADGFLPEAPEGFLTRLLWLDGKKLTKAPYMEAVWFHTTNDTGPKTHSHDFDELIGFLGTDPEHPEELGAEIQLLIDGEYISVTKSCIAYIPRGTDHSPLLVPSLKRPIIHFSGGNGGDYAMK
jgi:hypothetical protein